MCLLQIAHTLPVCNPYFMLWQDRQHSKASNALGSQAVTMLFEVNTGVDTIFVGAGLRMRSEWC